MSHTTGYDMSVLHAVLRSTTPTPADYLLEEVIVILERARCGEPGADAQHRIREIADAIHTHLVTECDETGIQRADLEQAEWDLNRASGARAA